jgi:hypothetical protein
LFSDFAPKRGKLWVDLGTARYPCQGGGFLIGIPFLREKLIAVKIKLMDIC